MRSKYEPDYSQPSQPFKAAAMNPNTIVNIMSSTDSGFFSSDASPSTTEVLDHVGDLDNLEGLDNKLANELAFASTSQAKPSAKILLVFPFNTSQLNNAFCIEYNQSARGMLELNGNTLGVTEALPTVTNSVAFRASGRQHFITITDEDVRSLEPNELLNDSLIDFWMKWITWNDPNGPHSTIHTFTSHFMSELRDNGVESVQSWTAKKGINVFNKRIIMFPINEDMYWSLFVLLNSAAIAMNYSDYTNESEECAM